MSKKHSEIGASSAERWMTCPGSVAKCRGLPNYESDYAKEGTAAHEVAELALLKFKGKKNAADYIGYVTENGITVTEEMAEAVQVYLDTVRGDLAKGDDLFIEREFDLSSLHPGMFGTNDASIFRKKMQRLSVYDYKHGAGKAVEVANNSQLKYYALGAMLGLNLPIKDVELVIVQPRCPHPDGPVRRWVIDSLELLDWSADLVRAAEATEAPDAPLVPGEHCRWCKANAICSETNRTSQELMAREFTDLTTYDPQELADTLDKLPLMEAFVKHVREFAYREALSGKKIPGYKLVEKEGRRQWKEEDTLVAGDLTAIEGFNPEDFVETSLKSPAQVEKVIKDKMKGKELKDKREAALWFVNDLCEKKSSGTVLVHTDDKRPEVSANGPLDFVALE